MKLVKYLAMLLAVLSTVVTYSQIRYYASNRVENAVNTYEEDGTYIEEFIAANSGGLSNPQDIILHPEGFFLVTGSDNPQIKKFDTETGAYLGDWSDPSFALGRPSKMSIGPDDLLYVTQWGTTAPTAKIVRFDLEGNYLGPFTPLAPTGLGHVWDTDGNFYLAIFGVNTGVGTVKKYDPDGNFLEDFIDSTILENPTYIWWDANGDMLVQDFTQGKVLRYNSDGDYLDDFITGLTQPEGYAILPNGNLLISERGGNQILEFDSSGTLLGRWDNGGTLEGPNFIEPIDLSIIGVPDNFINRILVTPTYGSIFNLHPELSVEYESIAIYSISGNLIDTLIPKQSNIWNASDVADGIYILVASGYSGKVYTQKITVNK